MDSDQGNIANSYLEGQPAGLAGFVSVGDAAYVARGGNAEQVVIAPQHADQQLDHRFTHRLLISALAQSPLRQLVGDNIQALDSGRVQHHFCSAGTSTDSVLNGSWISLEHTGVVISRADWTTNTFRSPPEAVAAFVKEEIRLSNKRNADFVKLNPGWD